MELFCDNHEIPDNPRCGSIVNLLVTNTAKYGKNSINFRGAMLWNIIPENIKLSKALSEFKKKLKKQFIAVLHAVF